MNTSCPNTVWGPGMLDNRRCDGELEVASEEVSNGDGVWAESGLAFWLPEGEDGKVTCSEGCVLTEKQIEKVEKEFSDDYYKS